MDDPATIAAWLTEAQRDLLNLAATNDFAVTLDWNRLYTGGLIKCLAPFDHDKDDNTAAFKIKPLGLAVRQHLQDTRHED